MFFFLSPNDQVMPGPSEDQHGTSHAPFPRRLIARIYTALLFAHAYAYHLNQRFGSITPSDLLHCVHQYEQ